MKIILETERLIMREMTAEDRPALAAILQDPLCMHAYEHPFSDEEVDNWLNNQLKRYRSHGFGLWAIVLKSTGRMIGQCGLTLQPVEGRNVPEVGYLLQRFFWGNGYAIEAARACRDYAFNILGYDEVYSIIRDSNLASQQVALKNGMAVRGLKIIHYHNMDMPHFIYSVKRMATFLPDGGSSSPAHYRFHIITGGPGSGKSTLIEALTLRGFTTMPEAGRAIIQDQSAIGGEALPWADRAAFAELMLSWEMRSHRQAYKFSGPVFFDRGVPDVAGYLNLCGLPVPAHITAAAEKFQYSSTVFIAPPWRQIFHEDQERKQSWAEAEATCQAMIDIYSSLGYKIKPLPLASVEDRLSFILKSLS